MRTRQTFATRNLAAIFRLGDERGAVAVEFAIVVPVFILMLLGALQFSLVYLSALQMRTAVAEAAANAGNPFYPQARDPAKIREAICKTMLLADNCTANLLIEQRPASALAGTYQAITGATFAVGSVNDILVIRAQAPIVTFVPGLPKLKVSASSIWLKK